MADLTPEDIQIMKDAIAQYEGSSGGMPASNPDEAADQAGDAAQDRQMLTAIVTALEAIIDEVETLKACHERLEATVNDEIIGGITKLYNENMRMDGIAGVKAKYSEQFSPYEGVFQALADDPNADIYAKLYDMIEEMKSGEGYSEEAEASHISGILDKLKAAAPAPAVVEVPKTEETTPAPESPEDALVSKLRAMKQKAGSRGSSTY